MKESTHDQVQGKYHEAKGKVKEKVGEMTNNPNLQAKGAGEKLAGKIQNKIGHVQEVIKKR